MLLCLDLGMVCSLAVVFAAGGAGGLRGSGLGCGSVSVVHVWCGCAACGGLLYGDAWTRKVYTMH